MSGLQLQDQVARHYFPEGTPLWNPAPDLLPLGRQKKGLRIGDVGIIEELGFEAFFNICSPLDHDLKAQYGFPSDFALLDAPADIPREYRNNYIFSSPKTHWIREQLEQPYVSPTSVDDSCVRTLYTANLSEDGAHILVPDGARCFTLKRKDLYQFERTSHTHWSQWSSFVEQYLGNRDTFYLITGLCRARSWGLASFSKHAAESQAVDVSCELVVQDNQLAPLQCEWFPLGRLDGHFGANTSDDETSESPTRTWPLDNQTIFVRTITITPNGPEPRLSRDQLGCSITVGDASNNGYTGGRSTKWSSLRPRLTRFFGCFRGPTNATGTATHVNANGVAIRHGREIIPPFHPSKAINQYLLGKRPSAKAAITDDGIWMHMLAKGWLLKLQDLESTIDAIVSEHYSIVLSNGIVYIRDKVVSLAHFGVDQANLPSDLTEYIEQDDQVPFARHPFGNTYRGRLCTPYGSAIKVAIKVIKIESADDRSFSRKEKEIKHLAEEFLLLNHINVLPLIWTTINPGQFTMVFPWAENGTLTSYVDSNHDHFIEMQILTLLHDVAAGLHYLHSNGIIHGSLSGSAVVVDTHGTALLADFGLLTPVDEHGSPLFGLLEKEPGVVRWTAPEALAKWDGGSVRTIQTKESDIYSFGCIMLQILSGKVPYHYYEHDDEVMSAISQGKTPERPNDIQVTDHQWMFIQQCWSSPSTVDSGFSSKDLVKFTTDDINKADSHPQNIKAHEKKQECERLYAQGHILEAAESLLEMMNTVDEDIKSDKFLLEWFADFTQRCIGALEVVGDDALRSKEQDKALAAYSATLSLDPLTPIIVLKKWTSTILTSRTAREALTTTANFKVSRFSIYRTICDVLMGEGRLLEAVKCFQQMREELSGVMDTHDERSGWEVDFQRRWMEESVDLINTAACEQEHSKAIGDHLHTSPLDPNSVKEIPSLLEFSNEFIKLDPSSYIGYKGKHAALIGMGRYDEAIDAFDTMLSRIEQSNDPEIRRLRKNYVSTSEKLKVIEDAIRNTSKHGPLVFIDVDSGRLFDKQEVPVLFRSSPAFKELVSSMTRKVDQERITKTVGRYFGYAMLSHVWGNGEEREKRNEPSFKALHDFGTVYNLPDMPMNNKLRGFCAEAARLDYRWAWSDTCCIDKSDDAILSWSVTSMYKWYENSDATLVHLGDVSGDLGDILHSLWMTRAWTLQEALAPRRILFYDRDWRLYHGIISDNHKRVSVILEELANATGIPSQILVSFHPDSLGVREKLRLASTRTATIEEDAAYSLAGIFKRNISPRYGEGEDALGHLLGGIVARMGEVSVLAWTGKQSSYHSCLPSTLAVYKTPYMWPTLDPDDMQLRMTQLSVSKDDATDLYHRVVRLPPAHFASRRLQLPCIVFEVKSLEVKDWDDYENRFRAKVSGLGTVEFSTPDRLPVAEPGRLVFVHPWISSILGPHRQSGNKVDVDLDWVDSGSEDEESDEGSMAAPPSPVTPYPTDDEGSLALEMLVRLQQPFEALLLLQQPYGEHKYYKRVAGEHEIIVQILEKKIVKPKGIRTDVLHVL